MLCLFRILKLDQDIFHLRPLSNSVRCQKSWKWSPKRREFETWSASSDDHALGASCCSEPGAGPSTLWGFCHHSPGREAWLLSRLLDQTRFQTAFLDGPAGKESACNAGDTEDVDSISELGRSPGVGNGSPVQYSCLENSIPWIEGPDRLQSKGSQ